MGEVEIKGREMIRPAKKTWTGKMELSELDVVVGKVFVPMLYLYNPNKEDEWSLISTRLKDSLSEALVHFYPFNGRLNPIRNGARLELVVDDEDEATWGVPLVEAYSPMEVAHFGDSAWIHAEEEGVLFRHLFPPPSMEDSFTKPIQELPLLSVQLTHFRCGGFAIGLSWSHAVVDGVGVAHFLSEWARFARGESLGMEPIYDRRLVGAGEPPRFVFEDVVEGGPPFLAPDAAIPIRNLILPLSKSQINKLKQSVSDIIGDARPYTRFEVMTAHLWRSTSKARGNQGTKQSVVAFSVNIRKWMNPPLPPNFDGNGIIVMTAMSESKDLNSNPLAYACGKIREAINKVTADLVMAHIEYLKSQQNLWSWRDLKTPDGLYVIPDLMLTTWQNISLDNLDFGWGNEAHMATPPLLTQGSASIRAGHEQGSVVVLVCLQLDQVHKFKDYFYHQLN